MNHVLKPLSRRDYFSGLLNPFRLDNPFRKRVAVVTAIFGGFDRLLPVDPSWSADADFFLFSDVEFDNPTVWQSVHCNYDHPDARRRARFVKTHLPTYFANYDCVIWVDGNVLICENPIRISNYLEENNFDFASFEHPQRLNVVAEAAACIQFGKEDPNVIGQHLAQNWGRLGMREALLFETMVCAMRPGNINVQRMCALWWEAIMKGSKRDQLSLPLSVLETADLKYGFLPDSIERSLWVAKKNHKKMEVSV